MVATLASGVAVVENDALACALRKQRKYDQLVKKLQAQAASVQSKKTVPVPAESTVRTRTNEFGDQTRSAPLSRRRAASAHRRAGRLFDSHMGPESDRGGSKDSWSGSWLDESRGTMGSGGASASLAPSTCLPP